MGLISSMSKLTIKKLNKNNIIGEFEEKDYNLLHNKILKLRNKDVIITEDIVKQLSENGATLVISEIGKIIIVSILALIFKVFIPTFIAMFIFSFLRKFAGGNHMSTFSKCFAVMIIAFLSLGFMAISLDLSNIMIIALYILNLTFAWQYAPQEREDKSDKDCNNGNKFKKITIVIILIGFFISVLLNSFDYLIIANAITLGILLEIMTVTPIGIKFFSWLDGGVR